MSEAPGILFTAFEPSGDEHAAPVIAALRAMLPKRAPIRAFGGPRMAEAGAELIETTTANAAMGVGAVGKLREQFALRRRFAKWLDDHPVAVHVPTDSPAANWGMCQLVKRRWGGVEGGDALGRVVHLVAPQVWAWASWRVRRLQRWSDHVLCLLPFEPAWFAAHGVEATFIGHPVFDEPQEDHELAWHAMNWPKPRVKLGLLPGSRPAEIDRNWPVIHEVARRMTRGTGDLGALIAAVDAPAAERIRRLTPQLPDNVRLVTGQTDGVLAWADVVLTVSGTASLHVARHNKPMTILFRASPVMWHALGRWLIETRTFSLPNLVAAGGPTDDRAKHVVREFIPFWGDPRPIVDELVSLIEDDAKRRAQTDALAGVARQFEGRHAGREAAEIIAGYWPGRSDD